MKDLACATKQEQEFFFKSFDYVFCGVEGVLWHSEDIIPGAAEALATFKALGKKIVYVSNDTTKSQKDLYSQLKSGGLDLDQTDIVHPPLVMIDFLKKRNFSKQIYVIGMRPLRTELQNSGFQVEEFNFSNPEESLPKYIKESIAVNDKVGAVIADLDFNMVRVHLQKAYTYLKNPEVLFITGGSNQRLSREPDQTLIGPGAFHKVLEDASGRKPHCLAKPGPELGNYIDEKFGVGDSSRVLFIGDSIPEDMGFATNCGYQKLLVLSGTTSREQLMEEWKFPEEYKPNYYAQSLKMVQETLK